MWQGILLAHGFMPAASPKALTAISRTIRRWTLHQRSDKSLRDLANMYNPYIGDWINYYGQFYRAQLRSTLQRIDGCLVRWARRKYKRLRERPKRHTRLVGSGAPCLSEPFAMLHAGHGVGPVVADC